MTVKTNWGFFIKKRSQRRWENESKPTFGLLVQDLTDRSLLVSPAAITALTAESQI